MFSIQCVLCRIYISIQIYIYISTHYLHHNKVFYACAYISCIAYVSMRAYVYVSVYVYVYVSVYLRVTCAHISVLARACALHIQTPRPALDTPTAYTTHTTYTTTPPPAT